jgi:predicted phosphodiesterase
MRVVLLSDTHGMLERVAVPDGDVLIHAGDLTALGSLEEVREVGRQIAALPHLHKVVIAGNHDFAFEEEPAAARAALAGLTYLQDELAEVAGLRIWGAPWQPAFGGWTFELPRGVALRRKWNLIPPNLDILVTHGPPWGHLDLTMSGQAAGCLDLLDTLRRVRPRLHVFGHIHESHGEMDWEGTRLVNASICTADYRPLRLPHVIDLPARQAGKPRPEPGTTRLRSRR